MNENKQLYKNSEIRKRKLFLPSLIIVLGAILLLVSLFTPFATATDDYREALEKNPDGYYYEALDMTNEEALNISIFEFGVMYAKASSVAIIGGFSTIYLVFIALYGVFVLLTTLFSFLKKAIPVIIFNLLSFGTFSIIKWDFSDRNVIGTKFYDYGATIYLTYIAVGLLLIGAVLLLVRKVKNKKDFNNQNSELSEE